MKPYAAFGARLREARKAAQMTQAKTSITLPYYGRLETGVAVCSMARLATLRRVLAFDANELVIALGVTTKELGGLHEAMQHRPQ